MDKLGIIILAAGLGKRMRSQIPKVLHTLCGKPLINFSLDTALSLSPEICSVVLGYKNELVRPIIPENVFVAIQEQQLGTGDAVKQAAPHFKNFDGNILVLCGDVPMLKPAILRKMINMMNQETAAVVLTTELSEPAGYGRIVRNEENCITSIIEEKDADTKVKAIKEINSGIYCFNSKLLFKYIQQLTNKNAQGEYYLTDIIGMLVEKKHRVAGCKTSNPVEVEGINDRKQLAYLEIEMYRNIANNYIDKGIFIIDPQSVRIDVNSKIGSETIIHPGVTIRNSIIGKNCEIRNSFISECDIKDNVKILDSVIEKSIINTRIEIDSFNKISETEIGTDSKIGANNSIHNCSFGPLTVIQNNSGLNYIKTGKSCVFSNNTSVCYYDGLNNHISEIGDEIFIGAGCQIIAPAIIETKSYITSGISITKDIKKESFVINNQQLTVKPGYLEKIKKKIEGGELK